MRRLVLGLLLVTACSPRKAILRGVADGFATPGKVFASDDDPELVRESIPVMLKMMEELHAELPDHKGLLLSLARTCTAYGAGFLQQDGDRLQEKDVAAARVIYARAKRMLLRGRGYGLDGLEVAVPGLRKVLESGSPDERTKFLGQVEKEDVGLLYWTGAAWGAAIAVAKDDMTLVGELPKVEQLMRRALALDEGFEEGAIHEFFIIYDSGRTPAQGGGPDRSRYHLEQAKKLSMNRKLSPLVSYAEAVLVTEQNKKEFERLLGEVVRTDVDADRDHRLVNILAQRRAHWLLSRTSDLFVD